MQRTRDSGVAQTLCVPLTKKVKESRVLLVGAGGIGCELLKNLVCCGFGTGTHLSDGQNGAQQDPPARKAEIVVIDLDTIDLSNLNRQFLFRKQHIKQKKALVAKETAGQFNPSANIDARYANIFDREYDVDFFESFDVVFNALDNLAARRHVNRMCLAANVPLIESGTTGFHGQVQAIQKGLTECYDCNEKPVQKSFPICTIRSTPSQPIHCIVWAKSYLLPELFGTSEEDSSDVAVTDGDNAEEVAKLKLEAEALKKIRGLMGKSEFAQAVFNKVFHDDIERLRSMSDMWKSRTPPQSLLFETLNIDKDPVSQGQQLATQDQKEWSVHDNLKVFCYSIDALSKRNLAGANVIAFDKDDKDTLDFVTSTANLRSHVFGVQLKSQWDIKQMAGNIIPAIATSNALTASLCVMEAFKIMRSQIAQANGTSLATSSNGRSVNGASSTGGLLGGAKMVFLTSKSTDRLITSQSLVPPKVGCPVCSPVYAKIVILQDSSPTLQDLVDLLRSRLLYDDFSITVGPNVVFDPELDDNLEKTLAELGMAGKDNSFFTVSDDSDEPRVDLLLSVKVKVVEGADVQLLPETIELPLKPAKAPLADEDQTMADAVATALPVSDKKRKRGADEEVDKSATTKKVKGEEKEVYVVEDDGAILLD